MNTILIEHIILLVRVDIYIYIYMYLYYLFKNIISISTDIKPYEVMYSMFHQLTIYIKKKRLQNMRISYVYHLLIIQI